LTSGTRIKQKGGGGGGRAGKKGKKIDAFDTGKKGKRRGTIHPKGGKRGFTPVGGRPLARHPKKKKRELRRGGKRRPISGKGRVLSSARDAHHR